MAFAPQIVIKRSGNRGYSSRIDQLWGVHLSGAVTGGLGWPGFVRSPSRGFSLGGRVSVQSVTISPSTHTPTCAPLAATVIVNHSKSFDTTRRALTRR